MCWFVLAHLVAFLVDLVAARRHPDRDKDLQILLLQHQVRLLQRRRPPPRLTCIVFHLRDPRLFPHIVTSGQDPAPDTATQAGGHDVGKPEGVAKMKMALRRFW